MSKPTPGPWSYVVTSEEVRDPQGACIGRFEPDSGPLAAAAPALLEALRELVDACFDYHDARHLTEPVTARTNTALHRALAAIEKAEARS
jgi:hypothetical protein